MAKTNLAGQLRILNIVVSLWFILAVIGQWIFAAYTILFYGKATVSGHMEDWNIVLPSGYIPGDRMGNLIVGIHLLLAAIIIIGGPLQLIPQMRTTFKVFHRWNGRAYILVAFLMSISGLYMVWVRGSVGGMTQHISISINALLIMIAAMFTIKHAMTYNFILHRIWAIRLFLFVNGVWFFRVGLFFWLFISQGPVGFDPVTFQGPFLSVLTFSQYIIPMVLFELYSKAKQSLNKKFIMTSVVILFLCTIIMGIGIVSATISVWLPKINY